MTLEYQPTYMQVKELEQVYKNKVNEYSQKFSDAKAHEMAAALIYNLLKERKKQSENLLGQSK